MNHICSTLDAELRMEEDGVSPVALVMAAVAFVYLTVKPGVLQGFVDTYIVAPFQGLTQPKLKRKDVRIGSKLAEGGFGVVYYGECLADVSGKAKKGDVRRLCYLDS
jgi:hypothetical protein